MDDGISFKKINIFSYVLPPVQTRTVNIDPIGTIYKFAKKDIEIKEDNIRLYGVVFLGFMATKCALKCVQCITNAVARHHYIVLEYGSLNKDKFKSGIFSYRKFLRIDWGKDGLTYRKGRTIDYHFDGKNKDELDRRDKEGCFHKNGGNPQRLIKLLKEVSDKAYNVSKWNCQHFSASVYDKLVE